MKYTNKQYLQSLSKNQQLDIMKADFFSSKELNVTKVDNAYLLPPILGNEKGAWFIGGVLDSNKNFISESGVFSYGERTRVYGQYEFSDDEVNYIDDEVIYFNYYLDQWGHFLIEMIGRLWYAIKNPNIKIVISVGLNSKKQVSGNFLQLFNLLGVEENRIITINKVTVIKKVIIPETSVLITKYWTKEYKSIIDLAVNNAMRDYCCNSDRRIYCSRKHFNNKEYGEQAIEDVFRKNNYEIVYMEELNTLEQIRLLNECREIVCLSGTLVHNAMFIRNENCRFTILNKTYKINPNIYLTNQLSSAIFTFVDSYLAPLPISIGKGPFIVTMTEELIEYCNDNNLIVENKTNINRALIFKYYLSYIKKYRKKIISGNSISESGFEMYNIKVKDIRNHYKDELKKL